MKFDSSNSRDRLKTEDPVKKGKEKPTYSDFILHLNNALSNTKAKDPVGPVHKIMKRGFQETIFPYHLEEITRNIFLWESFSRLAVKLAIEVNTGRPSGLIRRLMISIRQEAARRSAFPLEQVPLVTNVPNSERWDILEKWIRSSSWEENHDTHWLRYAFICITSENPTFEEFLIINLLLEKCCIKKKKETDTKKKKAIEPKNYQTFLKQVGGFLAAKKIVTSKINFGMDIHRILKDKFIKLRLNLDTVERDLLREKGRSSELQKQLDETHKDLQGYLEDISRLKKEIGEKDKALDEEKNRFNSLEEHWRRKVERELNGQAYDFKRFFEHEVREARLCLNRESPNIEMALSRIKNMEERLNKMGVTL